uniref:Uncharacterized protein n=1 Tax=Varanus komodoensis TaxID=61221 RepID=A0A8D2Q3U9_VARKO
EITIGCGGTKGTEMHTICTSTVGKGPGLIAWVLKPLNEGPRPPLRDLLSPRATGTAPHPTRPEEGSDESDAGSMGRVRGGNEGGAPLTFSPSACPASAPRASSAHSAVHVLPGTAMPAFPRPASPLARQPGRSLMAAEPGPEPYSRLYTIPTSATDAGPRTHCCVTWRRQPSASWKAPEGHGVQPPAAAGQSNSALVHTGGQGSV